MQPLKPWMRYLLCFAGCYNLLAGLSMLVFYHEGLQDARACPSPS